MPVVNLSALRYSSPWRRDENPLFDGFICCLSLDLPDSDYGGYWPSCKVFQLVAVYSVFAAYLVSKPT